MCVPSVAAASLLTLHLEHGGQTLLVQPTTGLVPLLMFLRGSEVDASDIANGRNFLFGALFLGFRLFSDIGVLLLGVGGGCLFAASYCLAVDVGAVRVFLQVGLVSASCQHLWVSTVVPTKLLLMLLIESVHCCLFRLLL